MKLGIFNKYGLNCRNLFSRVAGVLCVVEKKTYEISVHTGDEAGADTDSNVFIQITGDKATMSERQKLDNSSNNFEKGKCVSVI